MGGFSRSMLVTILLALGLLPPAASAFEVIPAPERLMDQGIRFAPGGGSTYHPIKTLPASPIFPAGVSRNTNAGSTTVHYELDSALFLIRTEQVAFGRSAYDGSGIQGHSLMSFAFSFRVDEPADYGMLGRFSSPFSRYARFEVRLENRATGEVLLHALQEGLERGAKEFLLGEQAGDGRNEFRGSKTGILDVDTLYRLTVVFELLDEPDLNGDQSGNGTFGMGIASRYDYLDTDEDGLLDRIDNCDEIPNADQEDRDADGRGDPCDPYPDEANHEVAMLQPVMDLCSGELGGAIAAEAICEAERAELITREQELRVEAREQDAELEWLERENGALEQEIAALRAVDSDGDGVPDHLDRCPGTRRLLRLDAEGCSLPQRVRRRGMSWR